MTRHFPGNGFVRFTEDHPVVWDDLRFPANAAKLLGNSDPDWEQFIDDGDASVGVYSYAFAKNVDQELFFQGQLPHGYKLGTNLRPHVHIGTNTTKTGTVTFAVEYTIVDINGTFSTTQTLKGTLTISANQQYKHSYLDLDDGDGSEIDGSGISGVSAMILARVYRDVSEDNFDDDFFLFEFDIHYQKDLEGSLEETTKF